jgi:general stress protein 26
MSVLRRSSWWALVVLISLASPNLIPTAAAEKTGDKAVLETARKIMIEVRYCSLTTLGEDGSPQVRAMDPFPPEDDMTVWLATNPKTRKPKQIRRDSRVALFYFDSSANAYVTILGDAQLVEDSTEKARRWKNSWKNFYEDENRGKDYLLIKVVPHRVEVSSPDIENPVWGPAVVRMNQ